ncbi:MAG: ATP-grasp domain-containing protein [Bacteroidia bacterium]|nr:ATP-grasp domain-containing protein [Bacteroidia bacterium]
MGGKKSSFWIKLRSWEYWPAWLTNIPVGFFWLYFAIRSRSLFFFNAANPAIENGGVMGESKIDILNQVAEAYKPQTLWVPGEELDKVHDKIEASGLHFPLVVKPNVGERGLGVEKINNQAALNAYLKKVQVDLIIQEYVDYSEEYSVLHYRFPNSKQGNITSLCHKVHLFVVGDGTSSLRQLIKGKDRALLQLDEMEKRYADRMEEILLEGEKLVLLPIGNHARGAMFLNANPKIDKQLLDTFDKISHQLEGIYICRYDLKCKDLESLREGKEFKILEINGVLGEPAHIYDPEYSVLQAYRDLFAHWEKVYEISKEVHEKDGVAYMKFSEMWDTLRRHLKYIKSFKRNLAHES